ncbi:MAG: hypothetical protein J7M19_09580, partial [Planctomycetes bacterium]|nr:hypothetical protein [Planctomycetota bacterium]
PHTAVLVSLGLYSAAIIAGVSLRLGTVSMRYVEPLVLMALPVFAVLADALFRERVKAALRSRRVVIAAVAIAFIACLAAFAQARRQWNRYKIGYRRAGVAVQEVVPNVSLITSSPRLSYYAGSSAAPVTPERLKAEIFAGGAARFEFVGLETKRFEEGELDRVQKALAGKGFGNRIWLDVQEDSMASHADRRILVYRKEAVSD